MRMGQNSAPIQGRFLNRHCEHMEVGPVSWSLAAIGRFQDTGGAVVYDYVAPCAIYWSSPCRKVTEKEV